MRSSRIIGFILLIFAVGMVGTPVRPAQAVSTGCQAMNGFPRSYTLLGIPPSFTFGNGFNAG
jgi:hypothetical protein